jgi:hypothetical protein
MWVSHISVVDPLKKIAPVIFLAKRSSTAITLKNIIQQQMNQKGNI